ncbi:hypothetical protein JHK84_045271 [Glycine max]|nr:hypothetical protein JHK84_045271 [Glycine max]
MELLEKAKSQVNLLKKQNKKLAKVVGGCLGQYYRYHGDWKSETQSVVSMLKFMHWLETRSLLEHKEAKEKLGAKSAVYEAELKREERERHPINQREKHTLYPIQDKSNVDVTIDAYHRYKELSETYNVPFVGTGSKESCQAFDKKGNVLAETSSKRCNTYVLKSGVVAVKPTRGRSSIGVRVAYGVNDSLVKANEIMYEGIDNKLLIEIFLEGGSELATIVLDVGFDSDSFLVVLLLTELPSRSKSLPHNKSFSRHEGTRKVSVIFGAVLLFRILA